MKWLFSFLLIVCGVQAEAFQYKVQDEAQLRARPLDLYELSKTFQAKGYHALSDRSVFQTGLPFDVAYISADWSRVFSIKTGLVAPSEFEGQIIESKKADALVFHFRHRGIPYLLVASGFSREEFQELVRTWAKKQTASKWSLLIPQAHAEICLSPTGSYSYMGELSVRLEDDSILAKAGECAMDAFSGVAGSFTGSFEFLKKLAFDRETLWKETKESMVALRDFALNIRQEMSKAFENLKGLSTQEKVKIACSVSGTLMGSAVQALLGGVALAKTLPVLTLKLKSLTEMLAKLGSLEGKSLQIPNKAKWTQEVVRCGL